MWEEYGFRVLMWFIIIFSAPACFYYSMSFGYGIADEGITRNTIGLLCQIIFFGILVNISINGLAEEYKRNAKR